MAKCGCYQEGRCCYCRGIYGINPPAFKEKDENGVEHAMCEACSQDATRAEEEVAKICSERNPA